MELKGVMKKSNNISFCILTAKNEKEYIKLLLNSLISNTNFNVHEVLIFIDSDNQNSYEELLKFKSSYNNIRIYKNDSIFPIGGQRNLSTLFSLAKNDIVCYLHSDMVVGKYFDTYILEGMCDVNTIVSCLRIEPPLHPPGPDKILQNFGVIPEEFDMNKFNAFVENIQRENRPTIRGHFAPFALYKSLWFDKLGGYDTQFRCSREDSDFVIRLMLNNITTVQSQKACAYHFSCVSSRGKNWFDTNDEQAKYKNVLQQHADEQELKRFIRKWGYFGHEIRPVFDTSLFIDVDRFVDFNLLLWLEPYFKRIYLTKLDVVNQLTHRIEFEAHYYSNLRWEYTPEHWNMVKPLFNPMDFNKRIIHTQSVNNCVGDIIIQCKYSEVSTNITKETQGFIENINSIINNNEIGTYTLPPFSINIIKKNDLSNTYKKTSNMEMLLSNIN